MSNSKTLRPAIGVTKAVGDRAEEVAASLAEYDSNFARCWRAADAAVAHMPKDRGHKDRARAWKVAFEAASAAL